MKPQQAYNKKSRARLVKPQQVDYKQLIQTEIRYKPSPQKILPDYITPTISGHSSSTNEIFDLKKIIRDDAQASYNPTYKESPRFAGQQTEKSYIQDRTLSSEIDDIPKQMKAMQNLVFDKKQKFPIKHE